jgi:hypothetical protein
LAGYRFAYFRTLAVKGEITIRKDKNHFSETTSYIILFHTGLTRAAVDSVNNPQDILVIGPSIL